MKIKKLKLGKEIVANLSKSELDQIKGGIYSDDCNDDYHSNGSACHSDSCLSCTCSNPSGGGAGCHTYYPCY